MGEDLLPSAQAASINCILVSIRYRYCFFYHEKIIPYLANVFCTAQTMIANYKVSEGMWFFELYLVFE
jgi:hypothetical protein